MSFALPKLYLARHGDTAWTDSHQHTGRSDLPLNERGEEHARQLGERLRTFTFARVFTSPLRRASKTCEMAGFGGGAEVDPDLTEWDYGRFEGKLTTEILAERPGWELYRDGSPAANRQKTLPREPTASSSGSTASAARCWLSPAATSSG